MVFSHNNQILQRFAEQLKTLVESQPWGNSYLDNPPTMGQPNAHMIPKVLKHTLEWISWHLALSGVYVYSMCDHARKR